ncbi:MAG: hypothetical protein KC613_13620, partial [Myxococcales bacterium]|nr:hypothetical protein [Myxococcales bacterium]
MRALAALALALVPTLALAHGGQPQVLRLDFAPQLPGQVFASTDNQGPYIGEPAAGFRWLCEDAIAANAGVRFVTPLGAGPTHWLVGTQDGLFETRNRGCDFAHLAGPLAAQRAVAASRHPARPAEVLVATDGFGQPNDVFRTTDGGETWAAAGLAVPDRITGLVRSEANPAVVYVAHALGAARSDDGG